MPLLTIIILSFVQGASEFLPISSSGHLIIMQQLLGVNGEGTLEFDVALHLGTILSIICYFYKDVKIILLDIFNVITFRRRKPEILWQLIISTIPAVIVGFYLIHFGWEDMFRRLPVIAFNLIFFGILLYVVDKKFPQLYSLYAISNKKAFIIGLAQALALIPGVSRSGICITAARFLKVEKKSSVEFAMLISIPAILGASLLSGVNIIKSNSPFNIQDFLYGIAFSFIFGLLFIKFLMSFVKRFSFKAFMIYRIVLGLVLLGFLYL